MKNQSYCIAKPFQQFGAAKFKYPHTVTNRKKSAISLVCLQEWSICANNLAIMRQLAYYTDKAAIIMWKLLHFCRIAPVFFVYATDLKFFGAILVAAVYLPVLSKDK